MRLTLTVAMLRAWLERVPEAQRRRVRVYAIEDRREGLGLADLQGRQLAWLPADPRKEIADRLEAGEDLGLPLQDPPPALEGREPLTVGTLLGMLPAWDDQTAVWSRQAGEETFVCIDDDSEHGFRIPCERRTS